MSGEADYDDRLSNYVPVAERLAEWWDRYPEGRIVCTTPITHDVAGQTFVAVTVSVYRDAQPDTLPAGVATCWEPYPGRTPYTLRSEQPNAETSAIGRALAAAGISAHRGMASAEDVGRARAATDDYVTRPVAKGTVLGAAQGDAELAGSWWAAAFAPGSDAMVHVDALDLLARLVAADAAAGHAEGTGEPPPDDAGPPVPEPAPDAAEGDTDSHVENDQPGDGPAGLAAARAALHGPGAP